MDFKEYFTQSLIDNTYNLKFILNYIDNNINKKEEILKYLMGPGRNSNFIPTINNFEELDTLFNLLLTREINASTQLIKEKINYQEKNVFPNIKSHTAKFINPSSSNSGVSLIKNDDINGYYHSGNIKNKRALSYSGNAGYQSERFFLESAFYYNNELTGFFEMIVKEDKDFDFLIVKYDIKETIDNIKLYYSLNQFTELSDTSPQIFFPIDNKKYIALSPLPSFSFLNQIKDACDDFYIRSQYEEKGTKKYKFRLSRKPIFIGGTQPQNIASFNSDNAGTYKMFTNTLPISYKKIGFNNNIFFRPSLIDKRLAKQKMQLTTNYIQLPGLKKKSYILSLIEHFLEEKTQLLLNLKDEVNDYREPIANGYLNSLEKDFLLNDNKDSSIVNYFYDVLIDLFFKFIDTSKLESNEQIDFVNKSQNLMLEQVERIIQ